MAVENSSKKYLNFDGLSYYDSKIKAWVEGKEYITNSALNGYATETWVGNNYQPKGDYQAAGHYVTDDAQGTVTKKINDSYSLWQSFLDGLTEAAPTLAELSADHNWLTTNKSGLESASSWVSTNGAKAKTAGEWIDANRVELDRAFVDLSGGNASSVKGYLPPAFGSLGTSVLGFSEMLRDYWSLGTSGVMSIADLVGADNVKDKRTLQQIGRLGLVESNLAWVAHKAIADGITASSAYSTANFAKDKINALSNELTGDSTAAEGSDARLGRVGVLEQKIGKLTKATSWLGTTTTKPTGNTITVNGVEGVKCSMGDIVTVISVNPEETGLEYIFNGVAWVELGDSSGSRSRIKVLEDTVGDASKGLVKDVDTLETIVGDASKGLVKSVSALENTVGDASKGLVKTVNDIQANYVLKSEIVFATTAEIDTLFA